MADWEVVNTSPLAPEPQGGGAWEVADKPKKLSRDDYIDYTIQGAEKRGLRPDVALSLFKQESDFNPTAKSPTGVRGISQTTLATGKKHKPDYNEADRSNPFTSIDVGLDEFAELYKKHGNYPKAVFHYNGGSDPKFEMNVGRHLSWARDEIGRRKKAATAWEPVGEPKPLVSEYDPITGKTWKQLEEEFVPLPPSDKDKVGFQLPIEEMLTAPEAPKPLPFFQKRTETAPTPVAAAPTPELDATTQTIAQFAEPAGEMVGKGINVPFIPLEMAAKAVSDKALRPVMDYAFPKATEKEKEMVQGGFEFVSTLGLAPTYLRLIGKGAQLLKDVGKTAFYRYAPDAFFRTGEAGLPVPLAPEKIRENLMGMTGAQRAEMVRKYPQFRDVMEEMTAVGQGVETVPPGAAIHPQAPPVPQNQFITQALQTLADSPGEAKQFQKTIMQAYARLYPEAGAKTFNEVAAAITPEDLAAMREKVPKAAKLIETLEGRIQQQAAQDEALMAQEQAAAAAQVQPPQVNMARPAAEPLFTPEQMKSITHEELLAMPPEQQKIFKQQLKQIEAESKTAEKEKVEKPKGKLRKVKAEAKPPAEAPTLAPAAISTKVTSVRKIEDMSIDERNAIVTRNLQNYAKGVEELDSKLANDKAELAKWRQDKVNSIDRTKDLKPQYQNLLYEYSDKKQSLSDKYQQDIKNLWEKTQSDSSPVTPPPAAAVAEAGAMPQVPAEGGVEGRGEAPWDKPEYGGIVPEQKKWRWWRDQLKKEVKPLDFDKLTEDQFIDGFKFLDKAEDILKRARKEVPGLKYNDIEFKEWPEWAKNEMIAAEKENIQIEDARGKAYQKLIELVKEKYPEKATGVDLGLVRPLFNKDAYRLLKGLEPTPAPQAGREAWEMTREEHLQSEYDKLKGQYPNAEEKDLMTTANMKVSTDRDKILMERAREGRIPDRVLDDIVERHGIGALRSLRGVYEKGAEGYLPPDVRNQDISKKLPNRKEKWEMSWKEFRQDQADAVSRKLTRTEWAEEKKRHHDIISKALYENKPVPPEVLADYPDLQAKYGNPDVVKSATSELTSENIKQNNYEINLSQKELDKARNILKKYYATGGGRKITDQEVINEIKNLLRKADSGKLDDFSIRVASALNVEQYRPKAKELNLPPAVRQAQAELAKEKGVAAEELEYKGVWELGDKKLHQFDYQFPDGKKTTWSAEAATKKPTLRKVKKGEPEEIGMKFGEHIGGSKFDRAHGILTVDDVKAMTDREAQVLVKKDYVWRRPDYAAMIEGGTPSHVAYLIKKMRDSIPSLPGKYNREDFVREVGRVRDILSDIKTEEDARKVFHQVFPDYAKDKTWTPENKKTALMLGGNKFIRTLQPSSWEVSRAKRKVEQGWPVSTKAGPRTIRKMPERPMLEDIIRTGEDYRQGKNITPDEFQKTFGFRGGEFGKWLNQSDRQASLNHAYDAFLDMANILDIPPNSLSLNGELGFAFGARGGGKYAAHYEPARIVINLTKTRGAGATAHEWAHGLDDYFSRLSGSKTVGDYTSKLAARKFKRVDREGKQVEISLRPEMIEAWQKVSDAIRMESPNYMKEARRLDVGRQKPYWTEPHEMFARAFETYIESKIEDLGVKSQYLVHDTYTFDKGYEESTGYHPYPMGTERENINKAFDNFFEVMEATPSKFKPGISELGAVGVDLKAAQGEKIPEAIKQAQDKIKGRVSRDESFERPTPWGFSRLYTNIVDRFHPLQKMVKAYSPQGLLAPKDPYAQARLFVGWHGKAEAFLQYRPFNRNKMEFEPNIKPLKEIVEPLEKSGQLENFDDYLVARRALERASKGFETGVDQAAAQAIVDFYGPQFAQDAKDFDKFMDAVLRYHRDSGLISKERYQQIKEGSIDYAPFLRLMEQEQRAAGGKGFEARQILKKFKGSERKIISPLESAIKLTYLMINAAERNHVGRTFVEWAKENGVLGTEVSKAKPKMFPVKTSWQELMGKNYTPEMQQAMEEGGVSPEDLLLFRPSGFRPAKDVIAVWENGKRKFYHVPEDIADIFGGMDEQNAGFWLRLFSAPAQALRLGATTLSPEFGVRNFLKDQFPAYIHSKHGYKPFIDFFKGVTELAQGGEKYWQYMISGAGHAELVSMDRRLLQKKLQDLASGKINIPGFIVRHPIEAMKILSEYSERGTRLGQFMQALRAGESIEESGLNARELTTDFGRRGAATKALNMLVAFWNANIQGLDRVVRAHKTNPFGTMAKAAAAITLPAILLELAFHDDDRYKNLPWWRRDLFFNIPSAVGVISLPKPWTYGLLYGSIPQRITNYILNQNPHAFDGLLTAIGRETPDVPIPTLAKPFLEAWANKSFFFDRPIVPKWKEELPPKYQYNEYNSETAKYLGRLIGKVPYVKDTAAASPAIIEHFVYSWTGGAGRLALNAVDYGGKQTGLINAVPSPARTLADIPVVRAFVARYPSANAQPIKDFYDNAAKIEANKKGFKEDIKRLSQRGQGKQAANLLEDLTAADFMNLTNTKKALSNSHKYIEMVYNHPDMAPDAKREAIEKTYITMINVTARLNAAIDKARGKPAKVQSQGTGNVRRMEANP